MNFFITALQPLVYQGLPIVEAWRSRSDRHTTFGTTPLDEWSARCKDLYLTTHNTHKRQKLLPPKPRGAGFEPAIPTSEKLQTHALDCAATGIVEGTPNTHKYTSFCISKFASCRMDQQSYISVEFSQVYVSYPLPSGVEVERQWNCTSTPPVCL
jgi:hypothetical protein